MRANESARNRRRKIGRRNERAADSAMGNRICRAKGRSGRSIEERFTRPHRLVRQPSDVDYKKLRKLILSEKLAPCFDGVEDSNPNLEECPICFFFYPSLNRSRCCMKGICTECFLQMKPSNATDRPTQCPFCKFVSYAVEYRGAKTEEEKSLEQAVGVLISDGLSPFQPWKDNHLAINCEEQKVIEAKIRMQSEDTDRVTLANCISSEMETQALGSNFGPRSNYRGDTQDGRDPHMAALEEMTVVAPSRNEDLDLDLEEIMMTEAIWRSIQDLGQSCGSSSNVELKSSGHESDECGPSSASVDERDVPSADSIDAGLAVAIARMAEHNIQRSEMLQFIRENNNLKQSIDAVGPTGASADHELNEVHLEGGCLESCSSTSEDDSWGLLATCLLEENPGLESGFVSDRDLVSEVAYDECCSSSSIHALSDGSGESSDCSNDRADTSCSHLSTSFTVVRPVIMSPNATA